MSNDNIDFGFYLVAYIDILGQKRILSDFDRKLVIGNTITDGELIEKIRESFGVVEYFKKGFLSFFDSLRNYNSNIILPLDTQLKYNSIRRTNIHFKRFSDSITLYTPLFDDNYPVTFNSIFIILSSIAIQSLSMLASKHPIRGGIDIGFGADIDELFYGPGLFNAYHLESKVADYPRVVVGDKLINHIIDHIKNKGASLYDNANRIFAKRCYSLIEKDFNNIHYIDLFASDIINANKEYEHLDIYKKAFDFINDSLIKHEHDKDPKIHQKYIKLERYFKKNMKLLSGV